jgi:hypothetical protein
MLQQAAQPGVMKLPCCGRFAVGLREGGIGQHSSQQQLEVGIGDGVDEAEKLIPERGYVVGGRGHQVGLVHLGRLSKAELIDLHLQAVVESGGASARLDDVALVEVPGDARVVGRPDAALKLTGFVAEDQIQIGLVGFGGALLLGEDKEVAVEELALVEVGQIGNVVLFNDSERLTHTTDLAKSRTGWD